MKWWVTLCLVLFSKMAFANQTCSLLFFEPEKTYPVISKAGETSKAKLPLIMLSDQSMSWDQVIDYANELLIKNYKSFYLLPFNQTFTPGQYYEVHVVHNYLKLKWNEVDIENAHRGVQGFTKSSIYRGYVKELITDEYGTLRRILIEGPHFPKGGIIVDLSNPPERIRTLPFFQQFFLTTTKVLFKKISSK